MRVYIQKGQKTTRLKFSGTVNGLLRKLKINPETVIVTQNSKLVTGEARLSETDEVEILEVVSGG